MLETTPTNSALNESWNGSAWTETTDLMIARNESGGCGTTTAALAFWRRNSFDTRFWSTLKLKQKNGMVHSWTEVGDLNGIRGNAGLGLQNCSFICWWSIRSQDFTKLIESWDGSAWTEIADVECC